MPPYTYYPTGYPYFQPQQPQQYQMQQNNQMQMTPPTIHAEIVQVEGENEAKNYPVAAGCTQMFMSKDDMHIYIKTAYANAPAQLIVYNKSEPIIEPQIDLNSFITRDEFEKRINELTNRHNNRQKQEERKGNG